MIGAIAVTAVFARQLQQLQPKAAAPSAVQKASGEFDAWTERPKSQEQKDQEYYAMYGSMPGRSSVAPARPMAAPPAPTSVGAMGPVVIDLSGNVPPGSDGGWVSEPEERGPYRGRSAIGPPPIAKPTGPTDEVVAPSHGRRVRDTATGEIAPRDEGRLSFERSSVEGGAVSQAAPPTRSASLLSQTPTRSTAPPQLPSDIPEAPPSPPPPSQLRSARPAFAAPQTGDSEGALPEGISTKAPAKAAFRGPSRGQTVVGAGQTGVQEGQVLTAATKSIRCPKCQTVFVGPAARPATVKCPACGTTGTLR